jgi:hypothetical protein
MLLVAKRGIASAADESGLRALLARCPIKPLIAATSAVGARFDVNVGDTTRADDQVRLRPADPRNGNERSE